MKEIRKVEEAIDIISIKNEIENINWEFEECDTQYLTHNIHRYSGKFIPQIANAVISLVTKENDIILDPYMGSGTTMLEASLLKRHSVGIDLNPLAVLISKVKNTPIEVNKLEMLEEHYHTFIRRIGDIDSKQLDLFSEEVQISNYDIKNDKRYNNDWNRKWYQEHVLEQLLVIYNDISNLEDLDCKNLAMVAFSDILRRCSNASSKYPNIMYDKNVKRKALPGKIFLDSLIDCISKVKKLNDNCNILNYRPEIYNENNIDISLENESVDAIVTHPPYIGSVPYAEYGCLSLEWLGVSHKQLDEKLTGGKRQKKDVVERFRTNYAMMIKESYRVLKKNKIMFIMVGNPTVSGNIIRLDHMTKDIASEVGFELISETTRKGKNRRGNNMGEEYLLFFKK